MAFAAPQTDAYYQWSATSAAPAWPKPVTVEPVAPPVAATPPDPVDASEPRLLTDRLNGKLREARAEGFAVLWITATLADLTTLLLEGGDQAILMDPDPQRDVAWYGGCRIRHSSDPGLRIYLEGEVEGEISCHIV